MFLVLGASCTDLKKKCFDESSVTGQTDKQQAEDDKVVYALLPSMYHIPNIRIIGDYDEAILPCEVLIG
jgi:hypothetical protein